MAEKSTSTKGRGFASMDQQRQREIASKGGKAAHQKGTAHEFTPEEARIAGRKGGEAVSRDRQHMAQIGREGGSSPNRNQPHPLQNPSAQTSRELDKEQVWRPEEQHPTRDEREESSDTDNPERMIR